MKPATIKSVLTKEVLQISDFQTYALQGTEVQWTANFKLSGGQIFHVCHNKNGYLYTPASTHTKLPLLKQIFWKKYQMGFGGRGCGYYTEVHLSKSASQTDKKAFEKILTPIEVNEGYWVPYPRYSYVPMLKRAFKITYAWGQRRDISEIMDQARQNLSDVLALRKATYRLERY